MAMKSRSSSALQFCGKLCLIWFKATFYALVLSVIFSVVKVAVSQEPNTEDDNMDYDDYYDANMSNCSVSDENTNCADLPADNFCLRCEFDYNCTYGEDTTVECEVPNDVICQGLRNFSRTFICQYCYQLPEEDQCCSINTTCNTRESPAANYIANCSPRGNITCLLPRMFQKQVRCNFSTGIRWTTAILLSFTVGGFGVDRFYLGLWGSAIGKLVSFGGLGVWSILDIILIGTGYVGPADGSVYVY